MNRSQRIALADAVMSIRPDWQQPGILAALGQLEGSWPGTAAALYAHAVTVAGNPNAHTPQAFNAIPPAPIAAPRPQHSSSRADLCYICQGTPADCAELHDWETGNDLPDPHHFETEAQAEANRGTHQIGEAIALVRERKAIRAKQRADRARAEILPMRTGASRTQAARPTCANCGGTMALIEAGQTTHPGCAA